MTPIRLAGISILILLIAVFSACANDKGTGTNGDGPGAGSNQGNGQGNSATGSGASTLNNPEDTVSISDISRGLNVWINSGCSQCHRIGDDPGGNTGPVLTGVGDRLSKSDLIEWIRNPQAVDPDASMPPHDLSDDDLEYLARYLSVLSSDTAGE